MSKIQHVDAQLLVCETLLHRLWWSAAVRGIGGVMLTARSRRWRPGRLDVSAVAGTEARFPVSRFQILSIPCLTL